MATADGRGPATAHVHEPEVVYDGNGTRMGKVCRCGEPYDELGTPVARLNGQRRNRALELHRQMLAEVGGG